MTVPPRARLVMFPAGLALDGYAYAYSLCYAGQARAGGLKHTVPQYNSSADTVYLG
jgi:hypothetical protein